MTSAAELGFRSELMFHRADGEVLDCRVEHGCRVIRTPSNPTFFWGNFLLFDRAPVAGDAQAWPALFERLISAIQPESTHRAFGWIADEEGDRQAFLRDGYTVNDAVVMQATSPPRASGPAMAARLRPFALHGSAAERDWARLVALNVANREPAHEEDAYCTFTRRRVAAWRALATAGRGNWFGAFVDGGQGESRLVSALGIFVEDRPEGAERLARYQSVVTDAAFRRRGLCRALMGLAARYACAERGADRLIVVAAAGEMPERLYASLGFETAGLQRGVQRMGV
jgi:ribosomal protein S18 acetylase RimI-like enzyme